MQFLGCLLGILIAIVIYVVVAMRESLRFFLRLLSGKPLSQNAQRDKRTAYQQTDASTESTEQTGTFSKENRQYVDFEEIKEENTQS